MEEVTAYRTMDGKKFLKKEDAEKHEKELGLKELSKNFYEESLGVFRDFLETDAEVPTESPGDFYFKNDIPIYWEGGEDLEEFVDFLVDIAVSYKGKTLEFINLIAKEISEKAK